MQAMKTVQKGVRQGVGALVKLGKQATKAQSSAAQQTTRDSQRPLYVPEKKIACLTGRLITEHSDIIQAKRLLHDVYITEGGWSFPTDNPTGFKIEQHDGVDHLTDDWDKHAYWFGVYHRDELVSCARLLQRDNEGRLDLGLYEASRKASIRHLIDHHQTPNLMEAQRCATRADFRSYGANGVALGMVAEQAHMSRSNVIGTTHIEFLKQIMLACGTQEVESDFDYGDGVKTTVLFWAWSQLPEVAQRLDQIVSKRLKTKTASE